MNPVLDGLPDPMTVTCSACLAGPGEPCYATSTDEPRHAPHRLRRLSASKNLTQCPNCSGMGFIPVIAATDPAT